MFSLLMLFVGAAFYVGQHFYGGATVGELSELVAEHYASVPAGVSKTASLAGSENDRVQTLVESRRDPQEKAGAIAIYFTPSKRLDPWGVDDRLVNLIEGARETVDCAFYDLGLQSVADALIEQHRAGVRVRIVSDTEYEAREAVQGCISAGIEVVFDARSAFMHNKFCVVDGATVWTGSMNVTDNGVFKNNNNVLQIDSVKLSRNYTVEFEEMFAKKKFGSRSPRGTPYPTLTIEGVEIENYFAPEDKVRREIISEIKQARERIEFMAFSFTSVEIAEAMADRMKEGVRVRGLFEKRSSGGPYARDDFLMASGAEIHFDRNPNTMHHKVIVIDGETVITGSYNFSKSAESKNDENVLILHDAEIAEKYIREFESLF